MTLKRIDIVRHQPSSLRLYPCSPFALPHKLAFCAHLTTNKQIIALCNLTLVRNHSRQHHYRTNADGSLNQCLDVLAAVFRNIMEHPDEAKFRKVRRSNGKFKVSRGSITNAMAFATCSAFICDLFCRNSMVRRISTVPVPV